MTRYVFIPEGSTKPERIYHNCAQFARDKGCNRVYVSNRIRNKGKYVCNLGTLWPVEMPRNEAQQSRKVNV